MMYMKCPSCKHMLCHLQVPYENQLNQIVNDPKLSEDTKNEEKIKLVNSFGLRRYCCVMRLMTYKRLVEIVK